MKRPCYGFFMSREYSQGGLNIQGGMLKTVLENYVRLINISLLP